MQEPRRGRFIEQDGTYLEALDSPEPHALETEMHIDGGV